MNKVKSVEQKLAALNSLRDAPRTSEVEDQLRQSLADRSNHVVERAADLVGDTKTLLPELLKAYQRLLIDPLKKDPRCVGKTAIVRALVRLEFDVVDFYRDGLVYEQMEPVWGGKVDVAAELRGLCAMGLVVCARAVEVLNRCAILLADEWAEARAGAARAIGALGQQEGGAILRLKVLTGDADPEVIGECCAALLRLRGADDIDFVRRLLSSANTALCIQAAVALAESRTAVAFDAISVAWRHQVAPEVRGDLLICLGMLRSSEANDFLLSLIDPDDLRVATDAIRALKIHGQTGDLPRRIKAAVDVAADRRLDRIFQEEWGTDR